MNKYSTTVNQLMTLYTAPDWLTETERGQKYLYKMAVDMYERINNTNEQRLKENFYAPVKRLQEETDSGVSAPSLISPEEIIKKIYLNEKVHFNIREALRKLKDSINSLNYKEMIINIDNIVSISHHGGPAIAYAGENNKYDDERIQKIKPQHRIDAGDDLESVIYQKWGDYFPEIAEGSGFIPEEAMGHNLRGREWKEIADFSDEKVLDNVVSILKNSIRNKKYKDENEDEERFEKTESWIKSWFFARFSEEEIIELIFSNTKKYGLLYNILENSPFHKIRDVVLKRLFILLLQGDKNTQEIFKDMDRRDFLRLRSDFNKIMELDYIEDFIIAFPFFSQTILYLEETMEILRYFLERNPELKKFVYQYYDDDVINFLENNKIASLKLLKIASIIDENNSDLSDKIEKLVKLSDFKSPQEVLRKTGIPSYMRDMMGLSTGIDPNKNIVYETPQNVHIDDFLGFAQPASKYNSSFGIEGVEEPAEANKNYAVYPDQSFPSLGIHEITHLRDMDNIGHRRFDTFFNNFIINYHFLYESEYALNNSELEAYFNEYIYVLYSKQNKISFENFYKLMTRKNLNIDLSIEQPITIMQYILFNKIKDNIETNGFKNTIKNKDNIFEQVKNNFINNVLTYYLQGEFMGENNTKQFFIKKLLMIWVKNSKAIDKDSKQKIISIINQLSNDQEPLDENTWREQ